MPYEDKRTYLTRCFPQLKYLTCLPTLKGSMDHQSQKSVWRDLPEDLLLKVLRNMALIDIWACRSLSRAWSIASASVLDVHFDVHVSVKDLHCKLRQILQQKPRDTHCTVKVTQPLQLSQLHQILRELQHQGTAIPNCKLVLETPYATAALSINPNAPKAIAACVQQLKVQGMEVIICLSANRRRPMPDPDDLRKLAPMLNAFSHTSSASGQHYTTPGWIHLVPRHTHIFEKDVADDNSGDDETWTDPWQKLQFRLQHLQALLPACKTLEMLCFSGEIVWSGSHRVAGPRLQLLGAFTNLKKLELQCQGIGSDRQCLQPLNTLSCLRDLTMIHYRSESFRDFDGNFCAQLVHFHWLDCPLPFFQSCSSALAAISRMAALQTLCMSVKQITMLEAIYLGGLSNPPSIQLCIREMVSGGVLGMLSSGHAHIQLLTLYRLPLSALSSLKPMEDLTCLKVLQVDSDGQFKLELQPQPHLQHLELRGVWLSEKQRAQLVCTLLACPALRVLIFSSQQRHLEVQKLVFHTRAGKGRPAGNHGVRWLRRSVIGVSVGLISRWVLATTFR